MEKKKMKLWKKILIIIVILLMLFVINTTRKTIILANLDKKVTDYENNNSNIYIRTTFDFVDYKSELERYIKDDVDKMIIEKTDLEGKKTKIIQIQYPEERKVYLESEDNKVMYVHQEKADVRGSHIENSANLSYTTIMNFAYSSSLPERVLMSIFTKIKTVEVDGKKCYELSNLFNGNFLYAENTIDMKAYVDKDTGLAVKLVEKFKKSEKIQGLTAPIENEEIKENITTYEYKFNEVTDKDMEEPDETEYKKQE